MKWTVSCLALSGYELNAVNAATSRLDCVRNCNNAPLHHALRDQ